MATNAMNVASEIARTGLPSVTPGRPVPGARRGTDSRSHRPSPRPCGLCPNRSELCPNLPSALEAPPGSGQLQARFLRLLIDGAFAPNPLGDSLLVTPHSNVPLRIQLRLSVSERFRRRARHADGERGVSPPGWYQRWSRAPRLTCQTVPSRIPPWCEQCGSSCD